MIDAERSPFPTMDVYCASCHECYHETLPTFDPDLPNSNDLQLKDFWRVECGWQGLPPETSSLDGEFLCPSCGNPMAHGDGRLILEEPGKVPSFAAPVRTPHPPEEIVEPSKGDALEAEIAANAEEVKAREEDAERKRLQAVSKAQKDMLIVACRDKQKMTFADIGKIVGLSERQAAKRYHATKGRMKSKR